MNASSKATDHRIGAANDNDVVTEPPDMDVRAALTCVAEAMGRHIVRQHIRARIAANDSQPWAIFKKWGNSASVRIPASVMAAAALHVDQAVDVREEGGRVVIEPIRAPVYDFDELLSAMTADTFPDDVDFGAPIGKEVW